MHASHERLDKVNVNFIFVVIAFIFYNVNKFITDFKYILK